MALTEAEELELLELEAAQAAKTTKSKNGTLFNTLRNYVSSVTGGISEPVSAATSAIGEKAAQGLGAFPEGSDRPISEAYKDYRQQGQEDLKQFRKESPGLALTSDLVGLVGPGAFSTAYKGSSKLASKLVPEVTKDAPFLSRLLSKIGAGAIRGGGSAGTYQALNPNVELEDKPLDVAKAAALGGTIDAGLGAGGVLYDASKEGIKSGAKALINYPIKYFEQTGFGKVFDVIEKQKFLDKFDDVAKKADVDTTISAGESFIEGVQSADQAAFDKYKAIKDPIMKKFKDSSASVERIRQKIINELDDAGAIDMKGNIDFDSVIFSGPEGAYYKRLAKDIDSLSQNPSMGELDRVLRGYGKLANFGKKVDRTPAESMFSKLWGAGRDDLLDNAERLLVESEKKAPQVRAASKGLDSALNKQSIAEKSAQTPLQGERMRQILAEDQALADKNVANADDALQSRLADAELKGTVTAQDLRAARKEFASQQPAFERLRKIANKDPEKIIKSARTNLPGSFIDDAIASNPELRDPLKKAVLGDLVRKSKSPEQLKKAMEEYGIDQLRNLFQFDFEVLQNLAGIKNSANSGQSFVSRLLRKKDYNILPISTAPILTSK